MAGRGRTPKAPGTRSRRNKTVAAAQLTAHEAPRDEAPPLGKHPTASRWHKRTRAWWEEVWSSPMAHEYLRADEDGLQMLAVLVDEFWREPTPKLAAEIRLQRVCFGLTPIDRRRLQWQVVREEEDTGEAERTPSSTSDPRDELRVLE